MKPQPPKPAKPCPRNFPIDVLKALSALTVILIHVTSHYTAVQYVERIWQWSHFAVGVFVFASGYLIAKYNDRLTTLSKMWGWLKKRALRLLQPYYLYVILHTFLLLLLPTIFDKTVSWDGEFILDTLFLNGGFGQNWIPRIFLFLSLLYLGIQLIRKFTKASTRIYLYTFFITLGISLVFLFPTWDIEWERAKHYQALSWFPLLLLGIIFYESKKKKALLSVGLFLSAVFTVAGSILLPLLGKPAGMYDNKYPPTLYFIAYNCGVAFLLYTLAQRVEHFVKSHKRLDTILVYLSKESYTIFFAHVIVMDALEQPTGFWLTDFLIISAVTLISVILWNRGASLVRRLFAPESSK